MRVRERHHFETTSFCPQCGTEAHSDGGRCPNCSQLREVRDYRIEARLPNEGTVNTYLALTREGQRVVLKEVRFSTVPTIAELELLEREATALRAIRHPNAPRVIETFQQGAGPSLRMFLVLEHIEGTSLSQAMQLPAALSIDKAADIATEILSVLEQMHRQTPPLLHRNITPRNIIIRSDGRAALVGFGTARFINRQNNAHSSLVGTFGYMPPEQLGGTVSPSGDVYSLAATLLHAVTLVEPKVNLESVYALEIPESVPPALRSWLQTATATNPDKRFASASEARRALRPSFGALRRIVRSLSQRGRTMLRTERPRFQLASFTMGAIVGIALTAGMYGIARQAPAPPALAPEPPQNIQRSQAAAHWRDAQAAWKNGNLNVTRYLGTLAQSEPTLHQEATRLLVRLQEVEGALTRARTTRECSDYKRVLALNPAVEEAIDHVRACDVPEPSRE